MNFVPVRNSEVAFSNFPKLIRFIASIILWIVIGMLWVLRMPVSKQRPERVHAYWDKRAQRWRKPGIIKAQSRSVGLLALPSWMWKAHPLSLILHQSKSFLINGLFPFGSTLSYRNFEYLILSTRAHINAV